MTATGLGSSSIWQPSQSPGDEYALLMKFRSPCPGDRGGSLGLPPCDPAKSGNAMCWITKILPDGSCLRCQSIIDGTKLQAEREGRPLGHTGIAKIAGHAVVTLNRIVASASRNRSPAARRRIRRRPIAELRGLRRPHRHHRAGLQVQMGLRGMPPVRTPSRRRIADYASGNLRLPLA